MRAYDRATFKRLATTEAAIGMASPPGAGGQGAVGAAPSQAGGAAWGRFLTVLEDAAGSLCGATERRALGRLIACGSKAVARSYACGGEDVAAEAWCGHPLCPTCAQAEAASAARTAGTAWEARVLQVRAPVGGGERTRLPSAACVASLREGWGHATRALEGTGGLPRLEPMPRTIVHPGGLLLFVRVPEGADEEALAGAVVQACRSAGFTVQARVVSREAAALAFAAARREEAERFVDEVGRDFARLDALAWRRGFAGDASLEAALRAMARRWIERVRGRAKSRRALVLGGKDALAAPRKRRARFAAEVCRDHGQDCRVLATVVRDGRRAVVFEDGRLPTAATPQAITTFFEEAAASAPIRIPLPQPIPAGARVRRAA